MAQEQRHQQLSCHAAFVSAARDGRYARSSRHAAVTVAEEQIAHLAALRLVRQLQPAYNADWPAGIARPSTPFGTRPERPHISGWAPRSGLPIQIAGSCRLRGANLPARC